MGNHNPYQYECLKTQTGIRKQYSKKQDDQLMCNIGQPCSYLRNQTFITKWLQKCEN